MRLQTALALFTATLGLATDVETQGFGEPKCKCTPADACWPKDCHWDTLSKALGKGKLMKLAPLAESCYEGPNKDLTKCAEVASKWTNQEWELSHPLGRSYPYNITCPAVNYAAGEQPTMQCILGIQPSYAIKVTERRDIALAIDFAKRNNVRLVTTAGGHDLFGRSDGHGALEIWLHDYTKAINFQQTFKSAKGCTKSGWTGSAIHIDGAWEWRRVFEVAKANNVIAVGGGSQTPNSIGGWPSGGGHGPASRNYGLGADQILEAEVMLADGRIVTANHCQNTDLFSAIRGGGPGYGVVLSEIIKVYPNVNVVGVHDLKFAPKEDTTDNKELLDAIATLYTHVPQMVRDGMAGYGLWFRHYPVAYIGTAKSGYKHTAWTIGQTKEETEAAMAPFLAALDQFKDKLTITSVYREYSDYWAFYFAESGLFDPVGGTSMITSRLINAEAVADYDKVREAVEVLGGGPNEVSSNVLLMVAGGANFENAKDQSSGLNPAWRVSPFVMVAGGGLGNKGYNKAARDALQYRVTYVKGAALQKLAPNTGSYMNEGDGADPEYIKNYYGANYARHLATKKKYDPKNLFYCRTCVGSDEFHDRPWGPLCRV